MMAVMRFTIAVGLCFYPDLPSFTLPSRLPTPKISVRLAKRKPLGERLNGMPTMAGWGGAASPLGEGGAIARLKDIAKIQGVRDNQLVGYGLVIGLNGTGDSLRSAPFTEQSLRAMLDNLGINPPPGDSRVLRMSQRLSLPPICRLLPVAVHASISRFHRSAMRHRWQAAHWS